MLEEAEKYAAADQEKRKNIDLKNQAETLCFEAEKELELLKDTITSEQKTQVTELITNIREAIKVENFDALNNVISSVHRQVEEVLKQLAHTFIPLIRSHWRKVTFKQLSG